VVNRGRIADTRDAVVVAASDIKLVTRNVVDIVAVTSDIVAVARDVVVLTREVVVISSYVEV